MTARTAARGFAYVEVLVAAFILALCAVPAANAIRNGLDAQQVGQSKAAELYCVRNLMETVLAEPYLRLSAAAVTAPPVTPPKMRYSLPADDTCAARTVTVTFSQFDGARLTDLPAAATDEQKNTALLKVRVALDGSSYAFSTVVAR